MGTDIVVMTEAHYRRDERRICVEQVRRFGSLLVDELLKEKNPQIKLIALTVGQVINKVAEHVAEGGAS